MIGNALFAKLGTVTAITDVVADRIYPTYIKQADKGGGFPQLVYDEKNADLPARGYSDNGGLVSVDVTITVVSKTYEEASNLARLVLAGLDSASGTWAGITVQGVFFEDVSEDVMTEPQTEEILYYLQILTFKSWFNL